MRNTTSAGGVLHLSCRPAVDNCSRERPGGVFMAGLRGGPGHGQAAPQTLSVHGCSLAWLGHPSHCSSSLCWADVGRELFPWGVMAEATQLSKGRDSRSLYGHLCSCATDFLLNFPGPKLFLQNSKLV